MMDPTPPTTPTPPPAARNAELGDDADSVLRRQLQWLVQQRWWIVPLCLALEFATDALGGRRTPPLIVGACGVLLAANAMYARLLRGRSHRRAAWMARVQPAVDVAVSAVVVALDAAPTDAVGYGLLSALVVSSLVLPQARALAGGGLAALGAITLWDFARSAPADRPRWALASGIAAFIAAIVGAINLRRERLDEALRQKTAALARANDELTRRERLSALGELAALVAHEVRNPLGVMYNALALLRRHPARDPDAGALLSIMNEETLRLRAMVDDLLEFARPVLPRLRPSALGPIVDAALARALPDPGARGIALERADAASAPVVQADPDLLGRALVQVIRNAVDAMPSGGHLVVRTSAEGDDASRARVEVSDTGAGMQAATLERAFEPFYTTKATGTGLGLVLVRRVVDGHRGRISIATEPGVGTSVTIELPTGAPN